MERPPNSPGGKGFYLRSDGGPQGGSSSFHFLLCDGSWVCKFSWKAKAEVRDGLSWLDPNSASSSFL